MIIDIGTMSVRPAGEALITRIRTPAGFPGDAMTTPTALDELDVRILRLLNADARKSYRDISKEADASLSTVSNRVRKLEQEGIISGYVPVLNEAKLGYDVLAVVGVKIHKGKLLEVQRRIAKDDRVTHVYDVTGEWDSIVVVRLRNTRDLDAFIKRLGSMEYVENTYTQVVLNVVKEERRVIL
jgi:DNA-binding Lrp family transcriptional regulator